VALATPVSFYYKEFSGHAYAENTATGAYSEQDDTSTSLINLSATRNNALSTAIARDQGYYLYADANVEGKNRFTDSWVEAYLPFTATCTDVRLRFDYGLGASTVGKASAAAELYVRIIDFGDSPPVDIFYLKVSASSEGTQQSSADEDSYFGTFNELLPPLVVGEVYALLYEVYYVSAGASPSIEPSAFAYGWLDKPRVTCLDDPSPVPVPGTWSLLTSGLVGLLGWPRRSRRADRILVLKNIKAVSS
jgi:hypothetical protein